MTSAIKLTETAVTKIKSPAKGRDYYRDTQTPGLYLCALASGSKVFEYVRKMHGRAMRLCIGHHPSTSAAQARREAVKLAGDMARGINPADRKRKIRAETTLGELFRHYIEAHAKPHKRSWQGDQDQYDRYLVKWKARKLSTIRKVDVAALHAKIGRKNGPYSANRCVAMLSKVFSHAAELGYDGANPAKGVKRFKEQSRDRFLRADELGAFFAALADERTKEIWRDFFALSLLTGARRSNVQAMRWADVSIERGIWRIPEAESKNNEPMLCVLHSDAVEILKRRADDNNGRSEFVFPSVGKTGHIAEPKGAWKDILTRAGLSNLRVHDLRRTLGSWQAATGASLSIIGRTLGHKDVATTAIYARLDLDPVRESVDTAVAAIKAAGSSQPSRPGRPPATVTSRPVTSFIGNLIPRDRASEARG